MSGKGGSVGLSGPIKGTPPGRGKGGSIMRRAIVQFVWGAVVGIVTGLVVLGLVALPWLLIIAAATSK